MRASFGLLLRPAAIRWACNLTLGPRQRERPGVDVVRDFQAEVSGPSQRVSRLSAVRDGASIRCVHKNVRLRPFLCPTRHLQEGFQKPLETDTYA